MALTGTTNTAANTAIRFLTQNSANASSSLAKLSSGSRIVKASDDAASLAVGTKIQSDVSALRQASSNSAQASSVLQVADGGLSQISDILQRMKALSVQSSSGSISDTERSFLNTEFTQLRTQVNEIANDTQFNGTQLLNGSAGSSLTVGTNLAASGISVQLSGDINFEGTNTEATASIAFDGTDTFTLVDYNGDQQEIQIPTTASPVIEGTFNFADSGISITLNNLDAGTAVGAQAFTVSGGNSLDFQVGLSSATDSISVSIDDVDTAALAIDASSIETSANAALASTALDGAIESVNQARAGVGAFISRFESVSANLATSIENLDAARSTLMDVDIAMEMTKFSSSQVLTQASTAMLAQANQLPQGLLRLLN